MQVALLAGDGQERDTTQILIKKKKMVRNREKEPHQPEGR